MVVQKYHEMPLIWKIIDSGRELKKYAQQNFNWIK